MAVTGAAGVPNHLAVAPLASTAQPACDASPTSTFWDPFARAATWWPITALDAPQVSALSAEPATTFSSVSATRIGLLELVL